MLDELAITVSAFGHASWKKRVGRAGMSLVSLAVVLTVGTSAAHNLLLNRPERSQIKHEALLPAPDSVLAPGEIVPTREAAAGGAQNVLLIGSDTVGSVADARSDIIVLVHISDDRRRVHLVHFPRDLYVDVPGKGLKRINTALTLGGPRLLVRTLQQLVDVPIDHVAVISFAGLQEMTDVLGGLDVIAAKASSGGGYFAVRKGVNHLDGTAALGFARERRLPGESDISRGQRQMALIKALLLKSLTTDTLRNPVRFAEFMDVAAHTLTVDEAFSVAEMRSLTAGLGALHSKDIVPITAPVRGLGKDPQGARVDLVNTSRMALLSSSLRRDQMASYPPG
jgi:LCP family protein required for cell wall assembly